MTTRAVVTWFLFIPVAMLNAVVRESLYEPTVGELRAHQISSVTGSAAFLAVAYALLHRHAKHAPDAALAKTGAAWLGGTVLFEFGFGHFVMGSSWSRLLHDYDLSAGRVWSLVLVTIAVAPVLVKRIARIVDERGAGGGRTRTSLPA